MPYPARSSGSSESRHCCCSCCLDDRVQKDCCPDFYHSEDCFGREWAVKFGQDRAKQFAIGFKGSNCYYYSIEQLPSCYLHYWFDWQPSQSHYLRRFIQQQQLFATANPHHHQRQPKPAAAIFYGRAWLVLLSGEKNLPKCSCLQSFHPRCYHWGYLGRLLVLQKTNLHHFTIAIIGWLLLEDRIVLTATAFHTLSSKTHYYSLRSQI